MAFVFLTLAGLVIGMAFNVFALVPFCFVAFFGCLLAEYHAGPLYAVMTAFAGLPTVQFGYVLGLISLGASDYLSTLRPGVRRG